MDVDYDPDDKEDEANEPPATEAKPVDFASLAAKQESEVREEVMDRVLALLEQQKVQRQAMMARQEEEQLRANWQDEAFRAVLGADPLKALPLLDEANSATILQMVDGNGLNLLHNAVRVMCWPVVQRLINLNPAVVDQLTSPQARPAHWSALMVLVDTNAVGDQEAYGAILTMLLEAMSLATLEARAANGNTALHLAAGQGNFWTMRKIVWEIYHKASGNQAAFGLVSSLLNLPDRKGAGCVTWKNYCNFLSIFGFILPW